jgi:hypothetical protein
MTLAFVQSNSSSTDLTGTTQAVTLTGVGAGHLLVCWLKHEGASTTYSLSDGTSTFTNGTIINHANGDLHGLWMYLLVGNSGDLTYTVTLGATRPFRRLHIWEFSYTGTASLDTQNTGSGNGATPVSGAITTTGTDAVVLGSYGEYNAGIVSAPVINGVAADGSRINSPALSFVATWYTLETATFAGGTASCSLTIADDWLCNVLALKTDAGGGGRTTRNAHPSGLGMQHGMGMTLPNGGRYL